MGSLSITLDVPLATCFVTGCQTAPIMFSPGMIEIDYSGDAPAYTARNLIPPTGWKLFSSENSNVVMCPTCQTNLMGSLGGVQ